LEEEKLKAKFPNAAGRPFGGHSAFLQKRLAKGVDINSANYRIEFQRFYKNNHLFFLIF